MTLVDMLCDGRLKSHTDVMAIGNALVAVRETIQVAGTPVVDHSPCRPLTDFITPDMETRDSAAEEVGKLMPTFSDIHERYSNDVQMATLVAKNNRDAAEVDYKHALNALDKQ